MEPPLDERNLDLTYPCPWEYVLFGPEERSLREAIISVVGEREHTVRPSRKSRTGKYTSLALTVVVQTSEERLETFRRLREYPGVLYVL